MARIKKFGDTRLERLTTFQTFLVDTNPNSTYFRISEFKDTFSGGKNGFLIEGSEFLKETTEIKIEILDVEGNPIYFEPGDGIPEYYEGVSKLISVHIYEDTPIGIGKITILGELKNYLDNGDVIRPVPDDWKGLYNVKWERDFKINRLLSNEDKVRFYRRPEITIDEISRPIFTATPTQIQQTGIVNGLPIVPTAGTRLTDFSLPTSYLLTIADNSNWTASVVGNPIVLPNLGVQLQSADVITNKQLTVSTPYTTDGIVQPFFNQPYTASFNYLELNSALGTALSGSFGKITITDLTTFVGDVARVKVFRKSQSEVSDFQFVQEIPLESNEVLIDLESSQRNQELYGLFTPFVIQNYWVTSSNNLSIDFNQDFLYNSVQINSTGSNLFFTSQSFAVNEGVEYTLTFNVRKVSNTNSGDYVKVFLGSTPGPIVEDTSGAIACSTAATYTGGESYPTTQSVNLGENTGTTNLQYNAISVPDRFIVEWDGSVRIDTGYVGTSDYDFGGGSRSVFNSACIGKIDPITGNSYPDFTTYPNDGYPRVTTSTPPLPAGSGSANFNKTSSTPQLANVKVYAPIAGTAWDLTLNCPQNPPTSGIERISNPTTIQNITNVQSSNTVLQKTPIQINFIADSINDVRLYLEVSGNDWYISDVSIRASQESSFSPDEITFIQPVPRTLETETFDFRFEFYDINNNYIPVLVEKTQTFNGGNLNRIAKSLELVPTSLYFQFDSGSGTGNPLPPTAIFIDVVKQFLTGSTNFTSRSFDLDNNELSASAYIGEQYPGLLIDEGNDRFRLTVQNFTGSKEDTIVQYIEYVAECEGVSDTIVITRVSDGKGGVNFEIRPFRGTVIRNKDELATLEVQAVRIDGINETNLVSGLPLNQSDTKLFVQSGSNYLTITEASSSGFLKNVVAGTTGSGELDYNAVFDRESIIGQLVLYLIPSSSANRAESIVSTLTLTDILDGLDAGFIEYDIDVFTINPRTEVVFTPVSASVTASYYRRGTSENPISASVIVYPSMSINEDFIPEYWMNYFTGSVNSDIIISGFDELGNTITPILPSSFNGSSLSQNKQLTLSFNYIEPFTSESVLVEHTFNVIPEGIPGQDAIIYEIIPSTVTLNANPNGIVTNFNPSATEIKVKQGFDYLAFTGSKKPGTFFISQDSVIGNNVTPGAVYFNNLYTQSLLVSASTAFDVLALSGSVEYLIEVHPFFTSSFFTQSLVQPYIKTLDGDNARSVTLEASSNIVNFDGNGVVLSPEGDIVLTATVFGSTGSLFYQFYRDATPYSTIQSSNIFEVGSGDAASAGQTVLWSVEVRDGSATSEVRAEGSVTIAGVQGGADAYNVQLTSENTSVVSSVFDVLTLSGSGTDILATKGDVALQAVTSFSTPQYDQLGTEIPNGEYRVKIASKSPYITLAGGLVSGSTVPVVGDIARIGDITAWSTARENPTAQIVYEINLENGRRTTFKTQSLSVQFEGEIGPGLIMRGVWTGSLQYIFDTPSKRRDSVIYPGGINETYYWASLTSSLNQPPPTIVGEPSEDPRDANAYWEYLGKEEFFVAAKLAIFEESFVKNTINVGNNPGSAFANIVIAGGRIDPYFAIGQNGTVGLSGDQTGSGIIGYDRPGIFMGTFDSSGTKTARLSLKNGAGDRYLRWDGSQLQLSGVLNAGGMLLGPDVSGSNDGLYINANNYWYDTGNFKVGTTGNYLEWDGAALIIKGSVRQTAAGDPEGRALGAWSASFSYLVNDIVSHNGRTWYCKVAHNSGTTPDDEPLVGSNYTTYWGLAADAGTSGTAGASGTNGTSGASGAAGDPGPGVVFRGVYSSGTIYFYTTARRDIVRGSDNNFYLANNLAKNGTSTWGDPTTTPADWTAFGAQFSSVATDVLLAQDATITRGLVMGAGDGGSSFIRSSGATSLTTGTGFYMSSSGNFRFGDTVSDTGSFVYWDGGTLEIGGIIKTRGGQNSELGNWLVDDQGRFRDSGSKVILNADQKGMFIQDSTGATKLSVRTGDLSSLTGGSVTNAPTTINHSALTYSTNQGFTQTFATTAFSANLEAGSYSFTINSTSITGTITHTSPTSGYFAISYGYEILNAANELVAFIGLGGGTSTGTGGSVIGQNQTGTITVPITGAHTIRPRYVVNVGFGSPGDVTFPTQNFSPGTLTFSRVNNFAELTDSGMQIVSSADNFVTIQRGGSFEISSRGISYFEHDGTGGSDNALRISGSITPWTAEEGTLGKSGQRWQELHVVDIVANGVMNMSGATGFKITIPNTATDVGGRGRANAWTTYSDRRIKDNIVSIKNGLEIISNLSPVKYRQYSSEYDDSGSLKLIKNEFNDTAGFIAQDVYDIIPEAVSVGKGDELWGLNDDKITPYLVKAIQELSQKVKDLELIISGSNNL